MALVEPSLPADLIGTYYRNGPGQFEVGGEKVLHPFDADGMVSAATFNGAGSCFFRNRFVRTQGFQQERRAGKMLYPGQFGNPKPFWAGGGTAKNVANTNVIYWGGRLMALWEGGQPHKLDPLSLGTAGATDLADVVPKGKSMTAHPRYDANTGRLVAYGYTPNPLTGTALRIFEFDPSFRLKGTVSEYKVPGVFGLFHDCAVTRNYIVFTASPQSLGDLKRAGLDFLLGRRALAESIEFDKTKPATFLVFRRDGADGGTPRVIPADCHFNFHYANAFEDPATGRLVLDSVRADELQLGDMAAGRAGGVPVWETVDFAGEVPPSRLWRYTLDVERGECVSAKCLSPRHLDFPVVNPVASCKEHTFVWANCGASEATAAPPQGIIRVDCSGEMPDQVDPRE